MGGAQYIGRVGALAVALGVGMAIATGHGVGIACADETTDSDTTSTSPQSNTVGDAATPSNEQQQQQAPSSSTTPPQGADPADDPADAGSQPSNSPSVPEMNHDDSGGAHISDSAAEAVLAEKPTTPESDTSETPAAHNLPESIEPAPGVENSPIGQSSTAEHVAVRGLLATSQLVTQPEDSPPATMRLIPDPFAQPGSSLNRSLQPQTLSLVQAPTPPPPVVAMTTFPGIIVNIATTLVAAFLSPFFTPGPVAPAEPPLLWAVLSWVRREITRTFFNSTPDAVADTTTTSQGTPTVIDVLGNDKDADLGDRLTVTAVTQPTNGTVVINPDGTLTYTPSPGFHGTDTFTYRISDEASRPHLHGIFGWFKPGGGHSDTAAVSVTVNATPIARNDTAITKEDTAVTGNVLANDTDAETDPLTVSNAGTIATGHGSVVLAANGDYTYTPAADFNGSDSFSYNVSDGGSSAAATATITVNPVNDTPVAKPDAVTTAEDTAVIIAALGNDTDADGDHLDRKLVTAPTGGTLAEINDGPDAGAWTYTPNPDFHGTDTFTYKAFDGTTYSDTVTVTIAVNPVNDAPVARTDAYTTDEDTVLTVVVPNGVTGNDSDVDGNTALTAAVVDQPTHGTLAFNPNGTFTFTPALNYHGEDTFTYRASDGQLSSATTTVTITVTSVNDVPVATPDSVTTDEDTAVIIAALGNDTDVDGDHLDRKLVTAPTGGTLAEINDGPDAGAWTYTPNPDFHGTDTFTYKAFDGTTYSDPVTVTITVNPVNDAPIANPDTYTVDQNATLNATIPNGVTGNDSDADDNTALTAAVVDQPTHGTLAFNPNGTFTYTPALNYHGEDTFTYRASDGQLTSATTTVTITVRPVVSPITANNDVYQGFPGSTVEITPGLTANDSTTLASPLGDITILTEPTNGFVYESFGVLYYRSGNDFIGTDTFTYVVADSANPKIVSNTATVTINVVRPITANDDAYTVIEGSSTDLTPAVTANDITRLNGPLGDATIVSQPSNGLLFNNNGVLTYRAGNNFLGTDTFTYTVADKFSPGIISNVATVTITVVPYNPLKATDDAYTILGRPTVLTPTANDTTDLGRPLGAIKVVDGPSHGTLDQTNGTMTYTPATGYVGPDSFTYTVGDSVDPAQMSNTATVTLTVVAYNPILANSDAYDVPFNTPTKLVPGLTFNDTTDLGNPLGAVRIVGNPAHGTLSTTGGALSYTPNTGYVGTDTFTYTVADSADPTKVSVPATVTLTVHPYSPIVARNDVYTVLSGTFTHLLPVITANDSTTANPLGAVTILTGPTHGYLTEQDGILTYRAGDYTGTDSFTYTVADSAYPDIVSNPATVTLNVVSSVPVYAGDDRFTVFTNEPRVLTEMIYNDRTLAGGPVGAITVVTQPIYGTLTESNGTLTYTPDTDFGGVDSFLYTVADPNDPTIVSIPAMVTLTVTDPIDAQNDFYATTAGVSIEFDPTFTANDINRTGNPLTDPVFGPTRGGTITKVDGKYYYTPPAGFTGLDSFYYTVADSENPARSDTALAFVTVYVD